MTPSPQAVLFDLDGTLFDRDASFLELVRAQYYAFHAELEGASPEVFIARVIELDEHGYADKSVVYRELAKHFGLPQSLAGDLTAHFQDTYASFSRCFPEVPRALADLRAYGMKLGIITNGSTRMQEEKIRQLGIADLFDDILISEREGLRKPDRRIFERAVERLCVESVNACYVGDHPLVDIRGAYDAGLITVWRRTAYWQTPDVPCYHIGDLDELIHMLEPGADPRVVKAVPR